MNLGVIVRQGKNLNLTLSSILYDKFGDPTKQDIYICDDWADGFAYAKKNYTHALFVDHGTVFTDWKQWLTFLRQYPHKGLVAHIIENKPQQVYLDQQCWLMELKNFDADDLDPAIREFPTPVSSKQHIHDNYTPLYVTPGTKLIKQEQTQFGQGLIAKQLNSKLPIMNWNLTARSLKHYAYDDSNGSILNLFDEYRAVAEHQLWVLNNEPVIVQGVANSCMPGSGLFWIMNIIDPLTRNLTLVDISVTQTNFCKYLWNQWAGKNYGQVAWQFIINNHVKHVQLDNAQLTSKEKIQLILQKNKFIEYVNQQFSETLKKLNVEDFPTAWQQAKKRVNLEVVNDNLITWLLATDKQFDKVWYSNILDYKWTLLHTTRCQYLKFQEKAHAN